MKFKKVIARFNADNIALAEEVISHIFFSCNLKGVISEVPIPEPDEGFGTHTLPVPSENSIIGYFPDTDDSDIVIAEIRQRLGALSHMDVDVETRSEVVDEKDWAHAWKAYFNVTRITDRIVVKPDWKPYDPKPRDIVIHIDPGMAFGTGTHPTTFMCLELIETFITQNSSLLDVGCGSGILMIAAAKLGATTMTGIDTDPVAVQITEENLEKNGISADSVSVLTTPLDKTPENQYKLITANIIAQVIVQILPDIARRLSPDGCAILSGIIDERMPDVQKALDASGLECIKKHQDAEWVAMAVGHKNSSPHV